jgi:hypothetical protein
MTEEQGNKVAELKTKLYFAIHELLNTTLAAEEREVNLEVRQQLTEEFRFWEIT